MHVLLHNTIEIARRVTHLLADCPLNDVLLAAGGLRVMAVIEPLCAALGTFAKDKRVIAKDRVRWPWLVADPAPVAFNRRLQSSPSWFSRA